MVQSQSEEKKMYEKSYGIVPVHEEHGEFLFLLVHGKTGHWGFPKGHTENGEGEVETARREFIEETGIIDFEIVEGPVFLERYYIGDDKNKIEKTVKYFIAQINEMKVTIQPNEIIGYGWFNCGDAQNIATYEDTKRIIREAKEYADKHFEKTI